MPAGLLEPKQPPEPQVHLPPQAAAGGRGHAPRALLLGQLTLDPPAAARARLAIRRNRAAILTT